MPDRYLHELGDQLAEHHIWMQRIRQGDRGAFQLLFREYYPLLVSFVYRFTKSRETAEDIVQELFLALWASRAELPAVHNVRTYLFHAGQNRAISYLRRQRLELDWQTEAPNALEKAESVSDSELDIVQMELVVALHRAIAELPDRGREVFLLSRRSHLTHAEIAARLNISVKTVEVHIGRALQKLRDRLKVFLT